MALTVLVDTCTLINLLATGELEAITGSMGSRFAICSAVLKETIYLRPENAGDPPDSINIAPLIRSGVLGVCSLESEEEELLYIDYASQLDDGEAMSLATARRRGFILATDDRKAERLFLEAVGDTARLISTSDIVRNWPDSGQVSAEKLSTIVHRIVQRARFAPSHSDPNIRWWRDASP